MGLWTNHSISLVLQSKIGNLPTLPSLGTGEQETQAEGFPKLREWFSVSGELWRGRKRGDNGEHYEKGLGGEVLSMGSVWGEVGCCGIDKVKEMPSS